MVLAVRDAINLLSWCCSGDRTHPGTSTLRSTRSVRAHALVAAALRSVRLSAPPDPTWGCKMLISTLSIAFSRVSPTLSLYILTLDFFEGRLLAASVGKICNPFALARMRGPSMMFRVVKRRKNSKDAILFFPMRHNTVSSSVLLSWKVKVFSRY